MKFDSPAGSNPVDRLRVIGQPVDRFEGPLKTTGTATYAYEHHLAGMRITYGWIVGAAIAKGRIASIDSTAAEAAPGVAAVLTHRNLPPLGTGEFYVQKMLAAPQVEHYHQPVAVVVAETFEQARAAAALLRIDYARSKGSFDLEAAAADAPLTPADQTNGEPESIVGEFARAFAQAPVTIDQTYVVPDQTHAMMEPHATIATWDGGRLTCWTSIQQINWGRRDLAAVLDMPQENIRLISPFVGGGFGGKGTVQADLALSAIAAKAVGRPVKIALQRLLVFNGTMHRPQTIQHVRLGADREGRLLAVGHDSVSGNLPGGRTEPAVLSTRTLYAGANRLTRMRLAVLDLAEGNAMRAPGEAPGLMALEIAMDELAEKLAMDPVELRIRNDTQVDPEDPGKPFSTRPFVRCLREGAERFGWAKRQSKPGRVREGRWLIGTGMAGAIRGAPVMPSGARATLGRDGVVTIEADMTDIGTGSYTIMQQTAAEMMGLPIGRVIVKLGDSNFPETPGSGGQWGAASSTAGVYAACAKLRDAVATRLGFDPVDASFDGGNVVAGNRSVRLAEAARDGIILAEDRIEYGDLKQRYAQQTFGAHFCEVAVDGYTGEVRVRRMLAVAAAGRILNPKTARSQVIGGMTMGIGAALLEEMVVDKRFGLFVNHDLAQYEVPVHADVPHLDVHFIDEVDPTMSPMKAKGVGELGLTGAAPAVANAVYNATGIRVRDYPITLDKYLERLPAVA